MLACIVLFLSTLKGVTMSYKFFKEIEFMWKNLKLSCINFLSSGVISFSPLAQAIKSSDFISVTVWPFEGPTIACSKEGFIDSFATATASKTTGFCINAIVWVGDIPKLSI